MAAALYPDCGPIATRFLEVRQHVGAELVGVGWVCRIEAQGPRGGDTVVVQTRDLAVMREKALRELYKVVARGLVRSGRGVVGVCV